MFKRFSTYNGSSPYKAPATLNVIPHIELSQGGFYVKGGMFKIAQALYDLALSLGVVFRFNEQVHEIAHRKGAVTGLIVSNGFKASDVVVANCDAHETYLNLLKGETLKTFKKKRLKRLEPSCSGFVILAGSTSAFNELTHHTVFFSENYEQEFDEIINKRIMPSDPTVYISNTSYSDPSDAPDGGSNLFIMVNAPYLSPEYDWNENSETYGRFVIKLLEKRGLKGLGASINYQKIINPRDFYSSYRSYKGSLYGTSSNSRSSAFVRPGNKSPWFNNLYLTGGGTHPGGGIPLVMLSALHAVTLIERNG